MYSKIFRYLFFIGLIITTSQLFAQQNQTDELGRKQGEWVKYKDGVKFYKGVFKDDKPTGEFLRYYRSGRLQSKSEFSNSGSNCYVEIYYDERKSPIKASGLYLNQQKDSLWQYYNKDSVLINEEFYNKGVADGLWKLYNYNGGLVKETPYKNGKIDGVQKEYFETGELKRVITFEMDSLNGDFLVNFPDETPRIKGQFYNGLQDGKWFYYNEDSSIEFIEYYEKGSLIKRTDEQGKPYELKQEVDTVNIGETPEEIMELH